MDSISNNVWQRRGSCVIFDRVSLSPFIANEAMISLRTLLSWEKGLPVNQPVAGRTIVVSGLETVIETMEPKMAEDFLRQRIRPMLVRIQSVWSETGIVFGFTAHPKAFEETTIEEEVLFKRRGSKSLRLSEGLWDGTATMNMKRIVRDGQKPGETETIGYYVARIS